MTGRNVRQKPVSPALPVIGRERIVIGKSFSFLGVLLNPFTIPL
jgi:hypothetical protein